MPDYVATVLGFLDTNWNTGNYDPKPELIDRRDSDPEDGSKWRSVTHDLTDGNAIGVSGGPGTSFEPEGLSWLVDRVEAGVSIRIEGAHEDEWGDITDSADFGALVDEAIRCLKVERKRPLPGYYRLEVRTVDNQSASYGDYFRTDLEAYFVGLEDLP